MGKDAKFDAWSAGQSYDQYMGRWSRVLAARYLDWLNAPANSDWLEIGCGTGALTETILSYASPRSIIATDASEDFVEHANSEITDTRAAFEVSDARELRFEAASIDVVTSALVMNFVPDKSAALLEMQRVLRPGGLLSFCVWDYPGGGVGFIDAFWKAAAKIDAKAADLNEGARFPFCTQAGLTEICAQAGLSQVSVDAIEIETEFRDFEDLWMPFTLGAGPAPGYCMSLPEDQRQALKGQMSQDAGPDTPIKLKARAWALKAVT